MRTKNLILTLLVVCCTTGLCAQTPKSAGKMSAWLRNQYQQQQEAVMKSGGRLRVQGRPVRNYILTLVESTDEAATIRQKGGVVWQDFGQGICAAFLPTDSLDVLGQSDAILRMEANAMPVAHNDTSAVITGVEKLWMAEAPLPQAFTGKGVYAGVMDVGFDFTHPAFRNDDGTSRIKWFWDPMVPNANDDILGMFYTTPEQVLIARHSSDADEQNHGSHVMGSMAGRGLDYCYVGMAPEADIIGAHMPLGNLTEKDFLPFAEYIKSHYGKDVLMDEAILQVQLSDIPGLVELYKIFEAADAAGQPCVVNWSFGSPANFLYDNRLFERVFNTLVGPGHIVVASAGNNGGYKTYLKKEADEVLNTMVFFLGGENYGILMRTAWEDPDFTLQLKISSLSDYFTVDTRAVKEALDKGESYEKQVLLPKPEGWDDEVLGEYVAEDHAFKIIVEFGNMADGRPGYLMQVLPSDIFSNPKAILGQIVVDTAVELELLSYCAGGAMVEFDMCDPSLTRGCNEGTLGTPASMDRIITVGAMHHRSTFTNVLFEETTTNKLASKEGQLASFSSCGPTIDGRIKPDVVAPGLNILSVLNSFYMKNGMGNEAAAAGINPRKVYASERYGRQYGMWAMSGTSMASPIAAGIVALWLQAKPDLTPEDILGVIERTSHQPEPEFSGTDKNIYYGWGEIDAYAGLLDVLGLATSVPGLSRHQPAGIIFRLSGRTLYLDGLDDAVAVTVYNLSGQPVLRTVCTDGSITLPNLPDGVYAVQLEQKGSTLIRL